MAARPIDILIRLQRITHGLEQGMSQSLVRNEMKDLLTNDTAVSFGFSSHVQHTLALLKNPDSGIDDILEEISVMEDYLQTDEYGFCEHPNRWYSL